MCSVSTTAVTIAWFCKTGQIYPSKTPPACDSLGFHGCSTLLSSSALNPRTQSAKPQTADTPKGTPAPKAQNLKLQTPQKEPSAQSAAKRKTSNCRHLKRNPPPKAQQSAKPQTADTSKEPSAQSAAKRKTSNRRHLKRTLRPKRSKAQNLKLQTPQKEPPRPKRKASNRRHLKRNPPPKPQQSAKPQTPQKEPSRQQHVSTQSADTSKGTLRPKRSKAQNLKPQTPQKEPPRPKRKASNRRHLKRNPRAQSAKPQTADTSKGTLRPNRSKAQDLKPQTPQKEPPRPKRKTSNRRHLNTPAHSIHQYCQACGG